jgi:hypothetical protein
MEEKAQKAAEHQAKSVEAEAEKARMQAEQQRTCRRGRSSQAHGRACGGGRGLGRGGVIASQGSDSSDSEGESSDSDSTATHDNDTPMPENTVVHHLPHACRAWAPRFFPDDDADEEIVATICPQPRPHPVQVLHAQVHLSTNDMNTAAAQSEGGQSTNVATPPVMDQLTGK